MRSQRIRHDWASDLGRLMLKKTEAKEERKTERIRDGWMPILLDGHEVRHKSVPVDGKPGVLQSTGLQVGT